MPAPARRYVLPGVVAAIGLAAISLLPTTRWIVADQICANGTLQSPPWPGFPFRPEEDKEFAAEARRHPDDIAMQVAAAGSNLTALDALQARYGHSPQLEAAILRSLSDQVELRGRDSDVAMLSASPTTVYRKAPTMNQTALGAWDRVAIAGERDDPTNAYFPALRAAGLFVAHRDAEACSEMRRAGDLPCYNDYRGENTTAEWRIADGIAGRETGAVTKATLVAMPSFPELPPLRDSARLATVCAVQSEQAGNIRGGFAIRRGVERLGARMRTDASTMDAAMAGRVIGLIAVARPGAAAAPIFPHEISGDARTARTSRQYEAYLQSIGQPAEAARVEYDIVASAITQHVARRGGDCGPISMAGYGRLATFWTLSAALLQSAMIVLVLGGIAAAYQRSYGVGARRRVRGAIMLLALPTIAICLVSMAAAVHRAILPYSLTSLGVLSPIQASTPPGFTTWAVAATIATVLLIHLPVLFLIALSIDRRVRHVPRAERIRTGYAGAALPMAIVLITVYVPMVYALGGFESGALEAQRQSAEHAGPANATWSGDTWPTFGPEEYAP